MGSVDREIPQGSVLGRIAKVAFKTAIATEPFFSHSGEISKFQQVVRVGTERTFGPLFNTEVRHAERLATADQFSKEGTGVVLDATHILRRDTAEIYRLICRSEEMRKKPVGIIAAEHIKEWWFSYAHGAFHSEIIYVKTEDTKLAYEKAGIQFDWREALRQFNGALDKAADILDHGGLLIVFGQGARSQYLYDAVNPSFVGKLYDRMNQRAKERGAEAPNFAILPVGMDLDESYDLAEYEANYEYLKLHLNRKLPYFIDVGYAQHASVYLERVGGNSSLLDYAILTDQEELVTKRYSNSDIFSDVE